MNIFEWVAVLAVGLTVLGGGTLFAAYCAAQAMPKKTLLSVGAGAALTIALAIVQLFHLAWVLGGGQPLESGLYRGTVYIAPGLFYCFGTAIVQPDRAPDWRLLRDLAPILVIWLLPAAIALPLTLAAGCGYAAALGILVFRARERRKQHRFELIFSIGIAGFAAMVLALGAAIPWLGATYFYLGYAITIGLAYMLVLVALVAIPDFVEELFEATRTKYANSTLGAISIPEKLAALEQLMRADQIYRDESLSLRSLAEALELSTHQLSELVNTQLHQSVTQYLKQQRVSAAQALLRAAPQQSILTVALEVGFRSQSTFYAAFKEATGQSPGDYRKVHLTRSS